MLNRYNWIYRSPDTGAGSGPPDGDGEGQGAQQPTGQQPPQQQQQAPRQSFENLLQRQGGADPTAWMLFQENHGYRERIRELEQQNEQLKGQLPGDGAVVLTGSKAEQWQTYQQLGKPEDLQNLQQEHSALSRRVMINEAAAAHGYKASVLDRLVTDDLQIEIRTKGEKTAAYVKAGEDEKETTLDEYAKANWSDFLPALSDEQQRKQPPNLNGDAGGTGSSQPDVERLKQRYGI